MFNINTQTLTILKIFIIRTWGRGIFFLIRIQTQTFNRAPNLFSINILTGIISKEGERWDRFTWDTSSPGLRNEFLKALHIKAAKIITGTGGIRYGVE